MTEARVSRRATLPDPVRVARCERAPELGPRITFFTGGTALRKLARALKRYTHNSVHLITPFDSGGSSALLRKTFDMLSVGDLRNRMLALADESVGGNPQIYDLFSHRLPKRGDAQALRDETHAMVSGEHPLVAAVPDPMRRVVRTHLRFFVDRMPRDFDLRGANVGNLILAGGYLANERDIDSVVYLFSRLVEVRGIVRPIVDDDLHLGVSLEDGTRIIGQHALTGKEAPAIQSPVARIDLVESLERDEVTQASIAPEIRRLITGSELICFPMGSFYSSVLANLLAQGVGRAVLDAACPRVYVPNTGRDPEQIGMTIASELRALHAAIERDVGAPVAPRDAIEFVLVDSQRADYGGRMDLSRVKELGVEVLDAPIAMRDDPTRIDPERLSHILLSLT